MKIFLSHCFGFLLLTLTEAANGQINITNSNPLNCGIGSYYMLTITGSNVSKVYEMDLNDSTVFNVVNASNNAGYALGIGNNLNSGGFSPTFYTNDINFTSHDNPTFYDSINWQNTGDSTNLFLSNATANGNLVFYTGAPYPYSINNYIVRYDGISFTNIYNSPSGTSIGVMDLAIDANNNIWFFTRSDSLPFFADSLNVIDSTGNLLFQYDTNFDVSNAFGMCIIQDTLYVAFGSLGAIYPNKLVSMLINGNTVSLGNPISFPALPNGTEGIDLASCNPGIPTGFKEIKKPTEASITLYPNPAVDKITVGNVPANAKQLCITNSMGAVVWQQDLKNEKEVELNTSRFALGMYAVCVKTDKAVLVKKMVKL